MGGVMEINGGAVVAMAGKGCVAIACDKRLGQQFLTVSTDFPKAFAMHDRLYLGLSGLATDVQTLSQLLRFRTGLYRLREEREIEPRAFAHLTSSVLYAKRFGPYYAEPIVCGLGGPNGDQPFVCSMDLIGCINWAEDFVVGGTASESLYGMCEALYEPDLEPEALFECISQALLNAVDRNALSGWGAVVHVITPTEVISRTLKGRQD
jgi:20S proteasome subunit beta 3